jgi:hypothetical protein
MFIKLSWPPKSATLLSIWEHNAGLEAELEVNSNDLEALALCKSYRPQHASKIYLICRLESGKLRRHKQPE